jgi:hypothetical protein
MTLEAAMKPRPSGFYAEKIVRSPQYLRTSCAVRAVRTW